MHHIVSDGWSVGVMIREVVRFYERYGADPAQGLPGEPVLPPLHIQYADLRGLAAGMVGRRAAGEQLAYWRSRLTPRARTAGTGDRPAAARGADVERREPLVHRRLPRPTAGSRPWPSGEGATLFMALLAGLQTLLLPLHGPGPISPSARPSPTATGARPRGSSASCSTPSCCEPTFRPGPAGSRPRFREAAGPGARGRVGRLRAPGLPFEMLSMALQRRHGT